MAGSVSLRTCRIERHLVCLALLAIYGCTDPSPGPGDGSTSPAEEGRAIAERIERDVPSDDAAVIDVISAAEGPVGSLVGFVLDDGQRLFAVGDQLGDESIVSGAVIEDADGDLILRQDLRNDGVTVSLASGDSFDLDISQPGLRLTLSLAGTSPPSTIVLRLDEFGNAVVDEDASVIHESANEGYASGDVRQRRSSAGAKLGPRLQATNDCPWVEGFSDAYDAACIGWNAYTARLPEEALKRACNAADLFLDSYRGSLPFDPGDEIRSRVIPLLKIGLSLGCEFIDNIWKLGKLIKKLSIPDAVCMLKSFGDELSRFVTEDGVAIDDALCDLIYGATCTNTCVLSDNGQCDDGRAGAATNFCQLGTDCRDCGAVGGSPPDGPLDCGGDGVCNIECPSATLDPDCSPSEICAAILYCCPNDGVCDAVYCPGGFADDPDCADESDCEYCCPNDGICDIATCPTEQYEFDLDCTNADYCQRLQVCCDDDRCDSAAFPCPEVDYDCGFCGVLDDVCIAECSPPDPDCPESGVELGDVQGFVVHAVTGIALSGAVVAVVDSGQTSTTDTAGAFLIENVPAGPNTLTASLEGFISASVPITVTASGVTSSTIGLVPMGAGDTKITVVLSWQNEPRDLDLHLSGPTSSGDRFHLAYFNRNPVEHACLDLDDTSSFGPETATISSLSDGTFVAGHYHVWVHNYSNTPEFDVSSASVTVYAGGVQLDQYEVVHAAGSSALDIWRVVNVDVSASGAVNLNDVQQRLLEGDQNAEY